MPLTGHFLFSGIIMYLIISFMSRKRFFPPSYYQDCKIVFKCYKKIIPATLIDLTVYVEFKSASSNMSDSF